MSRFTAPTLARVARVEVISSEHQLDEPVGRLKALGLRQELRLAASATMTVAIFIFVSSDNALIPEMSCVSETSLGRRLMMTFCALQFIGSQPEIRLLLE